MARDARRSATPGGEQRACSLTLVVHPWEAGAAGAAHSANATVCALVSTPAR